MPVDDLAITVTMASQITGVSIVCSPVCSGVDQRKHQSSASLAFVRGIHQCRWIPRTRGQQRENVSIWWRHHGRMRWKNICRHRDDHVRVHNVNTTEKTKGAKENGSHYAYIVELSSCPDYFWEPHRLSMELMEMSRATLAGMIEI